MTNTANTPWPMAPDETQVRILRAIGRMPYGAAVNYSYPPEGPTLENVGEYMERLADILEGVGERAEEREGRLYRLEHALAGVRWLFSPESEHRVTEQEG